VIHRYATIQQHVLEITVADRKHQVDRPQDHLGGELPVFERLIPPYLDSLSGVTGTQTNAATHPMLAA
jgi:hypothetical protein